MLLSQKGCISQRGGPWYHRIFVTLLALIKRQRRHSSTCLGVGCHFKLLCTCANVAPMWHCHGYQVASFSGFPPGNEAGRSPERTLFSVGSPSAPQATEASRVHRCQPLRGVVCLQWPKKNHKKQDKKKLALKDVGITMPITIQTRCRHVSTNKV